MPHDPVRLADTRAWLAKADRDLKTAAHELTAASPFTGSAVFHAQQVAEKAMKGRNIHRSRSRGVQGDRFAPAAGIRPAVSLGLLREREQTRASVLAEIREQIEVGARQADAGQLRDGREVFKDIRQRRVSKP